MWGVGERDGQDVGDDDSEGSKKEMKLKIMERERERGDNKDKKFWAESTERSVGCLLFNREMYIPFLNF